MGKSLDGEKFVKRDVVSANVEVISEENFNRRLEGMSSCANCHKERKKGGNSKKHSRKSKWKRQQVKTKSPIVIHLKDTLKSFNHRQNSFETDSSPETLSPVDHMSFDNQYYGSFIPPYYGQQYSAKVIFKDFKNAHKLTEKTKKKDTKNINALISNLEKAHLKSETSFDFNLSNVKEAKTSDRLNNINCSKELASDGSRKRNIINRDNIELICNDLYNSSEKSDSGTNDDSESEEQSSITSSSENLSDSGDAAVPIADESTFQFLPEELERLAAYTTGFPLFRYDCPPSQCPECINNSWTNYQYYNNYQGYNMFTPNPKSSPSQNSTEDSLQSDDEDEADSTILAEDHSEDLDQENSENIEAEPEEKSSIPLKKVPSKHVEVSVKHSMESKSSPAKRHRERRMSHRKNQRYGKKPWPKNFYMDLTGSDVKFSVYYEQNLSLNQHNHSPGGYSHPNSYYTPSHWSSPYCYQPYYMPPSHGHMSPLMSLSDSGLPKTVMIPPFELKKFNASAPPSRQWMAIAEPDRSRPTALFTVMCYNVLCDKYCTRQQYGYCPSWALNWEYRKKAIIEEIKSYSADIISLQEVETEQFHNFFLPELIREGYDGIFEPKSRAKTMTEQERKHVDGCAIFYKTNKFTLIKEQLIEFNQIAMANAEGSADMLNRVMTKDNIGLTALLETKEGVWEHGLPPENQIRQQIMVATAHIHWDPEYSDVKLIQTMMLMWELRNIIEETLQQFRPNSPSAKDVNAMPLLMCGDLNSLPDSGVVEYLTNAKVSATHIDFRELVYEHCLKKLNPNLADKESLTHNFRLGRAYNNSEIMPNTNYTYDFKGIIDYIFYSRDHMKLLGMLGAVDDEWFKENKIIGCPHPHIPSDHFSLFVEFEMPLPKMINSSRPSGPLNTPNKR